LGSYQYALWARTPREEKDIQEENWHKINAYLAQLCAAGSYVIIREDFIVRVYCEELIEDAVLRLAECDVHFSKPAFVEKLELSDE
jgi:hypothetical protein